MNFIQHLSSPQLTMPRLKGELASAFDDQHDGSTPNREWQQDVKSNWGTANYQDQFNALTGNTVNQQAGHRRLQPGEE